MAEITSAKPPLMENIPETQELDKALEEMDPDFAKNLENIQNVVPATDVHIETVDIEVDDSGEIIQAKKKSTIKAWLVQKKQALSAAMARARSRAWLFLKTVPKEVALATFATSKKAAKAVIGFLGQIIKGFFEFSLGQKVATVLLLGLTVTMWLVVKANLKGEWLPMLEPPLLTNFESRASSVTEFDPSRKMISFGRAFPQDPVLFLFDKMKVNLRKSSDHPLPMGAFELYAQVDSHETAVELQSRQVELHDDIERVIEGQTYGDVVSDLGKNRLKGLIKAEINHELTQGWVVDIDFKNFILKP